MNRALIYDDPELAITLLFRHRKDKGGKGLFLNCVFNLPNSNKETLGILYTKDCEYYVDSYEGVRPNIVKYEITDKHNKFMTLEGGFRRLNIRYYIPNFLINETNEIIRLLSMKNELVEAVKSKIPSASKNIIEIFLRENHNNTDITITKLKPIQSKLNSIFSRHTHINKSKVIKYLKDNNWDLTGLDNYVTMLLK